MSAEVGAVRANTPPSTTDVGAAERRIVLPLQFGCMVNEWAEADSGQSVQVCK